MIILSADNRSIPVSTPYTYLTDNTQSGVTSLTVVSTSEFSVDDFILVGLFGNPTSEIFRIASIDSGNEVINLHTVAGAGATTAFAHPESTKISILPFNQVKFYWTALTGTIADENPVFDSLNPLTGWLDIDPGSWFTSYEDDTHSTGFGWFVLQNSVTSVSSQNSNAIPYAGFSSNTVQYIIKDFLSLLNNRELKLVTQDDMLSWLNEGVIMILNKLNLSNPEYTVSTVQTITFLNGVSEYLLPSDFGDLVQIVDNGNCPIPFISMRDAMSYVFTQPAYYVRGRYLGFVPVPSTANSSFTGAFYRYRSKGNRLTGLDDPVDLPDNGAYVVKDWMMYRACLKFQNPNAQIYYKGFSDGMNQMIVSSKQRDANLDSWGIARSANA